MVGLSGFEPLTSRLSAARSSQLSYRPVERLGPALPRRIGTRKGLNEHTGRPESDPDGSLKTRYARDQTVAKFDLFDFP